MILLGGMDVMDEVYGDGCYGRSIRSARAILLRHSAA